MNETMRSQLTRLLNGCKVNWIEMQIKAKTKDGEEYTLQRDEIKPEKALDFAEAVYTETLKNLLSNTELIEQGNGFEFAEDEMACIRKDEIIKVWAEIGPICVDGMPAEK